MDMQELHRGRLIDHIQIVVRDLDASQRFYSAIVEAEYHGEGKRSAPSVRINF